MKHYKESEFIRKTKIAYHNFTKKAKEVINRRTRNIGNVITEQIKRIDHKFDNKERKPLTNYEKLMHELKTIKYLLFLISRIFYHNFVCFLYSLMRTTNEEDCCSGADSRVGTVPGNRGVRCGSRSGFHRTEGFWL